MRLRRWAPALTSDRGFTLIEALVALAIGGFVVATLATITGQWMRTWRAGLPALQRSEMLVSSLDRIVADLSAARFMPTGPTGLGLLFAGEETSVTLVRRSLPVELPAGLEIVRLASRPGDATLMRSRSPLAFGSFPSAPSDLSPVALLRPPYGVRFAYADLGGTWQTSWRSDTRLPRLIRVQVIDRASGRPVLAPIVVRVHIDAPPLCASGIATTRFCDTSLGLAREQASPEAASHLPSPGTL